MRVRTDTTEVRIDRATGGVELIAPAGIEFLELDSTGSLPSVRDSWRGLKMIALDTDLTTAAVRELLRTVPVKNPGQAPSRESLTRLVDAIVKTWRPFALVVAGYRKASAASFYDFRKFGMLSLPQGATSVAAIRGNRGRDRFCGLASVFRPARAKQRGWETISSSSQRFGARKLARSLPSLPSSS